MNTSNASYIAISTPNHVVKVCKNFSSQVDALTNYVHEGIQKKEGIIVIAKPALRKAVFSRLEGLGFNNEMLKVQGQVKYFDAEFLLSNLCIDGVIEDETFYKILGPSIQAVQSKFSQVRVFGEMVDILWQSDLKNMAIKLEGLWDSLCKKQELMFMCTYLLDSLSPSNYENALELIYKYHPTIMPSSFEPEPGEIKQGALVEAWNRALVEFLHTKEPVRLNTTVY